MFTNLYKSFPLTEVRHVSFSRRPVLSLAWPNFLTEAIIETWSQASLPAPPGGFHSLNLHQILPGGIKVWLAKWCKIHKVYIRSHSMLLLLFTNIFIHIQQLILL